MRHPLIIRADASHRMGTGHVMRCIAMGQAWQAAGGKVIFVSCCDSESIKQRIMDEGFDMVGLPQAYPASKEDLKTTIQTAMAAGSKWLVTDGYQFDLEYQQAVRRAGFKLLCVDDCNHLLEYESDILLNQNLGAEKLDYHCNPECRKLLGLHYVMLRKEFRCDEPKSSQSVLGRNVLVTMGGSDPGNATLRVIQAIDQLEIPDLHVKIIVGPANPYLQSLQRAIALSTINYELIESCKHMLEVMLWADIAISAAGSTCWELCRTGIPFMTLVVAGNQREVAAGLDRSGVAMNLGEGDHVEPLQITNALVALLTDRAERERMGAAGGKLVDGLGLDRVLSEPAKNSGVDLHSHRMAFRNVTMQDAEILFAWANDPQTRNSSFSSAMVDRETHMKWLQDKSSSSESLLLLVDLDGIPCGHIRYDMDNERVLLLSFLVAPDFRGLGLACPIILYSLGLAVEKFGEVGVRAYSLHDNIRAHKALLNAGFSISWEKCDFMKQTCCEFKTTLRQKDCA